MKKNQNQIFILRLCISMQFYIFENPSEKFITKYKFFSFFVSMIFKVLPDKTSFFK